MTPKRTNSVSYTHLDVYKRQEMLLRTSQTSANILNEKGQCVFDGRHCDLGGKISTIVPITGGGERQGTLLLAKFESEFNDEDLILAEYGATDVYKRQTWMRSCRI